MHAGSVLETCWEHAGSVQGDAEGKFGACWEMLEACRKILGACWKVFPQKLLEMLDCDLLLKMVDPREPIVCA